MLEDEEMYYLFYELVYISNHNELFDTLYYEALDEIDIETLAEYTTRIIFGYEADG